MVLRDRLIQLCESGQVVRLFTGRGDDSYLARITRVGHDYVEFDAFRDGEKYAEVLMLLPDVRRVEVFNVYTARSDLKRLYNASADDGDVALED